jgi:hypothetical protein
MIGAAQFENSWITDDSFVSQECVFDNELRAFINISFN